MSTIPTWLRIRIHVRGPDECWPWREAKNANGYGVLLRKALGKTQLAHRVVFELVNGVELTPEEKVLHSCDNPPCCNPRHLFQGTQQDNVIDMYAKGRGPTNKARGERQHSSIYTAEQVLEMRSRYAPDCPYAVKKSLAQELGGTPQAIHAILTGKTWRHLLTPMQGPTVEL